MNNFNLEYKLKEFRKERKELFDEEGKRYTGVGMSNRQANLMLEIINEMEQEIDSLETQISFNNEQIFELNERITDLKNEKTVFI